MCFWLMAAANHSSLCEDRHRLLLKNVARKEALFSNHAAIVCFKRQKEKNFVFRRREKCGDTNLAQPTDEPHGHVFLFNPPPPPDIQGDFDPPPSRERKYPLWVFFLERPIVRYKCMAS